MLRAAVPNLAPLGRLTARIQAGMTKKQLGMAALKDTLNSCLHKTLPPIIKLFPYLSRSLLSALADLTKFSPEILDRTP